MSLKGKICIVGNSPKVLETPKGYLIDKFENVVRFNRSPTKGYEEFTGKNTKFRFVNRTVLKNDKEHKDEDLTFIGKIRNETIILDDEPTATLLFNLNFHKSCTNITIGRYKELKQMLKTHLPEVTFNGKKPTGGMAMIAYFLNRDYDVVIHGFGLEDNIGESVIPHFFEKKTMKTTHDYSFEVGILNKLLDKNVIRLL